MTRRTYTLTLTEMEWNHLRLAMYCFGNEEMEPKGEATHMRIWSKIVKEEEK